jgi:hypothetical protein
MSVWKQRSAIITGIVSGTLANHAMPTHLSKFLIAPAVFERNGDS